MKTLPPEDATVLARVERGDLIDGGDDLLVMIRRDPETRHLFCAVREYVRLAHDLAAEDVADARPVRRRLHRKLRSARILTRGGLAFAVAWSRLRRSEKCAMRKKLGGVARQGVARWLAGSIPDLVMLRRIETVFRIPVADWDARNA
jgi:hypothetical protein